MQQTRHDDSVPLKKRTKLRTSKTGFCFKEDVTRTCCSGSRSQFWYRCLTTLSIYYVFFFNYFLQDLCTEWAKKPKEEQSFEAFHRAVSAAAAHQYGRTKYKVNTLMVVSCFWVVIVLDALSSMSLNYLTVTSLQACYLNWKKEIFQINTIGWEIPTGGRDTSWLYTSMTEEVIWGLPRNNSWPLYFKSGALTTVTSLSRWLLTVYNSYGGLSIT